MLRAELNPSSLQTYSRVSGWLYLAIIVIALISASGVDARLFVDGNNLQTAKNILENEVLFRLGVVAVVVMYACVVALSGTLYLVLRHVDEKLALLGMLFRASEGVIGAGVTLLNLFYLAVLNGKSGVGGLAQVKVEPLTGLLMAARNSSLDVVLLFVGIGGSLFCYLFFTSRFVPKGLAAWGVFTYISMLLLSLVSLAYPQHPVWLDMVFYGAGTLFEVAFGVWLALKGVNLTASYK